MPRLSTAAFALLMGACQSPVDTESYLAITSVSPSGGAANVSLDAPVVVSFSESLDQSTVNSTAIYLTDAAGEAVSTELVYDDAYFSLTLRPEADLSTASSYTLVVTEGLRGSRSGALVRQVEHSFSTMGELASSDGLPVADAGLDRTVPVGELVTVDGSGSSDPQGDPLSYAWTLEESPEGSGAQLDDGSLATPSFTADLPGAYILSLVVSDATHSSDADFVQVAAE